MLIRVPVAGVTPTELSWYPATDRNSGEKRMGAVPGHELSGVVKAIGEDVGRTRNRALARQAYTAGKLRQRSGKVVVDIGTAA